jgi:hypothetical protein
MPGGRIGRSSIPWVATALALGYPAAVAAGPWALAGVTAAAAVAACALALARRPAPRLRAALVAIALWLAAGFVGALLLRGRTLPGFAWVLLVLYLLPLPAVPYLYARTFDPPEDPVRGKKAEGRGTAEMACDSSPGMPSLFLLPSSFFRFRYRPRSRRALDGTPPERPGGAR